MEESLFLWAMSVRHTKMPLSLQTANLTTKDFNDGRKKVCCGREISGERRRREFAVGERDLYGEEEK